MRRVTAVLSGGTAACPSSPVAVSLSHSGVFSVSGNREILAAVGTTHDAAALVEQITGVGKDVGLVIDHPARADLAALLLVAGRDERLRRG